jgi:A1 cistron-splicing factor AAR2
MTSDASPQPQPVLHLLIIMFLLHDTQSQTGPNFKGIKMIPPGLHLLHYGSSEADRQGMFLNASAGSIDVLRWDPTAEDLTRGDATLPEGSLASLASAVLGGQLDSSLGPYPAEEAGMWINLSNCITQSVLSRCGVQPGAKISPGTDAGDSEQTVTAAADTTAQSTSTDSEQTVTAAADTTAQSTSTATTSAAVVPYFADLARVARFSTMSAPHQTLSSSSSSSSSSAVQSEPAAVTHAHMDRLGQVQELVQRRFNGSWKELLGELQLAFVLFLLLSSLSAFKQWQQLTAALCRCETVAESDAGFYKSYIRVLHAQLKLVPEDFFATELSKKNFLVSSLSAMFQVRIAVLCMNLGV